MRGSFFMCLCLFRNTKNWTFITGVCLMVTEVLVPLCLLPSSFIFTSRSSFRRCWRSFRILPYSRPPVWARSPPSTTSTPSRAARSEVCPEPRLSEGRRGLRALLTLWPRASSWRRRSSRRVWWWGLLRTPSRRWWVAPSRQAYIQGSEICHWFWTSVR